MRNRPILSILALAALVSAGTYGAATYTTITSARLVNSLIDSTPIGSNTPSTGLFNLVGVVGNGVTGYASAGAYTAWNVRGIGQGETDFVNGKGTGSGGFVWWNGASGSNPGTALMTLGSNGALAAGPGTLSTLDITGNVAGNYASQGLYLNWNQDGGGLGEVDFLNNRGVGPGGYNWYNGSAGTSIGTKIMTLGANGTLTLASGLNGLQSLATITLPCSSPGANSSCYYPLNISRPYTNTNYSVTCNGAYEPRSGSPVVNYIDKFTDHINVAVSGGYFTEIDCTLVGGLFVNP